MANGIQCVDGRGSGPTNYIMRNITQVFLYVFTSPAKSLISLTKTFIETKFQETIPKKTHFVYNFKIIIEAETCDAGNFAVNSIQPMRREALRHSKFDIKPEAD